MIRKRIFASVLLLIGVISMWYTYLGNVVYIMETYDSTQAAVEALFTSSLMLRAEQMQKIGIVTVLSTAADRSRYRTAMETMECYALMHNYTYLVLSGADYKRECSQKDIMFQRHCIVATILESFEWILFVDADIGVVNEKGTLEKFLEPEKDIIFYNRFFNHEVMAGSYLVKRSAFSKRFLRGWADYESLLPRSFHGRDNGAIHMWLIKQLPWLDGKQCELLWNVSTDYITLEHFTVCCRELLQAANFSNIRILEKGQAWARDGWLTNSHWNPEIDFMFHARKEADKRTYGAKNIGSLSGDLFFPWFNTLKIPVIIEECRNATLQWDNDPKLIVSKTSILQHLDSWRRRVDFEYKTVARIARAKLPGFMKTRANNSTRGL